jgi:hypothetical protein
VLLAADDATSDPLLDALWNGVLDAWDDERAHAALLDHALRVHGLPEVAGRYRALVDDEVKGPLAKKKIEAIVVSATSMLWSTKMPVPATVPLSITLTAVGVMFFLLSWLAWSLFPHPG